MEVSIRIEEQMQVVSILEARIDAAVALDFKDAMRKATADGPETVVLDLGHVDFIDSSGLGAIVATMKLLSPDRKLVLAGLTPAVDKVFKLTRMDTVFSLFATLQEAMEAEGA
jgi:anti-sigma B factor antagonist